MTARLQAVQWVCDWCQAASEQVPLAPSGVIVESKLPDGWTGIGYGALRNNLLFGIRLNDAFGTDVQHLCPSCSARPVGELLTWIGRIPEKNTHV